MHNGMMQLGGEAMSKSTGVVLSIEEFLEMHEADVLRILVLNSHYRSPLSFGDEIVEGAKRGLDRIKAALKPAVPGEGKAAGQSLEALMEVRDSLPEGDLWQVAHEPRLTETEMQNSELVELLLEMRNQFREVEQWALADQIRDRLAEEGIVLEDGKQGTTWSFNGQGS
jgi:cysteinyl-tRNA synthetase